MQRKDAPPIACHRGASVVDILRRAGSRKSADQTKTTSPPTNCVQQNSEQKQQGQQTSPPTQQARKPGSLFYGAAVQKTELVPYLPPRYLGSAWSRIDREICESTGTEGLLAAPPTIDEVPPGAVVVRGFVQRVCYAREDGSHVFFFEERDLPETKAQREARGKAEKSKGGNKKKAEGGRKRKKRQDESEAEEDMASALLDGGDDPDFVLEKDDGGDDDGEEEDGEAGDVAESDEERQNVELEKKEVDSDPAGTKDGYIADGFVVQDSDEGESDAERPPTKKKKTKKGQEASKKSKGSTKKSEGESGSDTPKKSKGSTKKSEGESGSDTSKKSKRSTKKSEGGSGSEAKEKTNASPDKNASEETKDGDGEPLDSVLDELEKMSADLPEDVRSEMNAFKQPSLIEEVDDAGEVVSTKRLRDESDEKAGDVKRQKFGPPKVKAGERHKLTGKLPTTSPLIILDLLVSPDDRVLRVLAVHRTWENVLTKKGFQSGLLDLGLWDATKGPLAFRKMGGKGSDPLCVESFVWLADFNMGWLGAGLLNSDEEMRLCSAIGVQTYTNLRAKPALLHGLLETTRLDPASILFAGEKWASGPLSELRDFGGLRRTTFDSYKALLPNGVEPNPVIRAAWELYDRAVEALERFGESMVSVPEPMTEALRGGMEHLLERRCVVTISDDGDSDRRRPPREYYALSSVFYAERELATFFLTRGQYDASLQGRLSEAPLDDCITKEKRVEICDDMRSDLLSAVKWAEKTGVSVVVGPPDVAPFFISALDRLHPRAKIVVGCFSSQTKNQLPTAHYLQTDEGKTRFGSACLNARGKPGARIEAYAVITDVQWAGCKTLGRLLRDGSITEAWKVVLIGDDRLPVIPPKPPRDFGRPFVGLLETEGEVPRRSYVCSQIEKPGPQRAMEEVCGTPRRAVSVLRRGGSGVEFANNLEEVKQLGVNVVVFSTAKDGQELLGEREPNKDTFRKGEAVVVKTAGRPTIAGVLKALVVNGVDALATSRIVQQPFGGTTEYGTAAGRIPIRIELDDSGTAGQHESCVSHDYRPLGHVTGCSIRTVPPFKVPKV